MSGSSRNYTMEAAAGGHRRGGAEELSRQHG